ncbi:hypothetical protein KI387_031666, partial [Taxus chinensis]
MGVKEYIEGLYKLSLRSSHIEYDTDKLARYLNGLRFQIHDELRLKNPMTLEKCYQLATITEEKLRRRHNQQSRGRGRILRNKGYQGGRGQPQRTQ